MRRKSRARAVTLGVIAACVLVLWAGPALYSAVNVLFHPASTPADVKIEVPGGPSFDPDLPVGGTETTP